jgi:hypothetical protein
MGSTPSKISASRGAAVLGLSEWTTPFEVWQKIMEEIHPGFNADRGYVLPVFEGNAATRWGTAFEDAVIELAEQAAGDQIIDPEWEYGIDFNGNRFGGAGVQKNELPITCHIDGRYRRSCKENNILHEGKTTNSRTYYKKWGSPGSDRIPQSYAIQVQHQMMCTGADSCIVSVLVFPRMVDEWEKMGITVTTGKDFPGLEKQGYDEPMIWAPADANPEQAHFRKHFTTVRSWAGVFAQAGYFHQYPIQADPAVQAELLKRYTEFWITHIIGETPPAPQNMDDIKRLCPEPHGTVIATEKIERASAERKGIGEEESRLKKRKNILSAEIMAAALECDRSVDEESCEKILILDSQGRKLHSYGTDKRGRKVFR